MNDTDTTAYPPRLPWNKGKISGRGLEIAAAQ